MAIQTPNFTTPPNVGPEPPGLAEAVGQKIFGRGGPTGPPDPYALTDEQLVKLLTDTRQFCEPGRELFEYGWWRNLLYLLGRQWIYWNPTSRQWNDKRIAKWIPKPVTNIIRTGVLSIRATLQNIDPGCAILPNGNSPKNINAAQTADKLQPLIALEHEMGDVLLEADFWAIVTGTAFLHTFWDKDDRKNQVSVDQWKCQICNTVSDSDQIVQAQQRCPQCQSMALMPMPAVMKPVGRGKTLAVSPLEALMPLYAQKWEQVDRIVYLAWQPRHELEDEFGSDITKGLNYDTGPQQRSLQLYKALATTSDLQLSPSAWNTGAFTGQTEGATVQHLWIKPCKAYPEGLYQKFLGDSVPRVARTQDRPTIPCTRRDGTPLWPWVHYPFEPFAGRLYAQGTIDVIVQKQDQINQVDSMTQLSIQRMGNPIWREEKGQEVERFTGEPGLVLRWQRTGPNSQPPDRMPGEPVNQSNFALRDQYKADAEELAGTYDVLKGAKPSGVEAYSALQLLVDQSQSRFKTLFKSRGRAYRDWYEIAIELERTHGPTERVRAILGPNRSWTFETFEKMSLDGDIEIRIEDGSTTPKTALGRRAAVEHAKQLQLISPGDPEQQYNLLNELGLPELAPSLDANVNSALQEQDDFEKWVAAGYAGPCPLIRYPWQSDLVHLQENKKWMNGDFIRELIKSLQQTDPQRLQQLLVVLETHIQQHEQGLMMSQGLMMPAAPGAPNVPGGGPPAPNPNNKGGEGVGAGRAMANSAQESNKPQMAPAGA